MSDTHTPLWQNTAGKFIECDATQLAQLLPMCALELRADVHSVDVRSAQDTAAAMSILAQRLQFPDYFGNNLDALYDMTGECFDHLQAQLDTSPAAVPQVWLIQSASAQAKMLFPVLDTLRDAMSSVTGVGLTIIWVTI